MHTKKPPIKSTYWSQYSIKQKGICKHLYQVQSCRCLVAGSSTIWSLLLILVRSDGPQSAHHDFNPPPPQHHLSKSAPGFTLVLQQHVSLSDTVGVWQSKSSYFAPQQQYVFFSAFLFVLAERVCVLTPQSQQQHSSIAFVKTKPIYIYVFY